jgi:hypothetical protein
MATLIFQRTPVRRPCGIQERADFRAPADVPEAAGFFAAPVTRGAGTADADAEVADAVDADLVVADLVSDSVPGVPFLICAGPISPVRP